MSQADTDGTQAPDPGDTFTDPTVGLVSSGRPEFTVRKDDEAGRSRGVPPVRVDADMVREMVDAAMGAETSAAGSGDDEGAARGDGAGEAPGAEAAKDEGDPGAVVPRPRRRLPARSQLMPQLLRRRQRPDDGSWLAAGRRQSAEVAAPVERTAQVVPTRSTEPAEPIEGAEPAPRPESSEEADQVDEAESPGRSPGGRRLSSGTVGVTVAITLLLVFVLVAVLLVADLLQSIAGLFS